ncbi:endoglucanase [Phenylobacterium sp.]|uniref:tetratricopeptide repeat protein n=1 Tax=Phenylobacterium sp. TaxID=1871053 RepID=UPI0035B21EBC
MNLSRALRSGVAAICIACVAAPAGLAAPAGTIQVSVADSKDFTRIELKSSGGAKAAIRREGHDVILAFPRDADPDITRLKVDPPDGVKAVTARRAGSKLEVVLTLADDADANSGFADGAAYLNVFKKKPQDAAAKPAEAKAEAEAAPAPEPEPVKRPDPIPAGGVVHMAAQVDPGKVTLSFPWAKPNGAAVFRRGDAVWVVFDAPATLDVSRAPRGLRQFKGVTAYKGADYSAVRIDATSTTPVFASNDGATWTVTLGSAASGKQSAVKVERAPGGGPAALSAAIAGVTKVVKVTDPAAGDAITVATALGPAKGLPSRREFVQMALLPSAQGLAMEAYTDDVGMTFDGDLVSIGRPEGLALSPQAAFAERHTAEPGAPQPAGLPALIDYENWPRTGSGGFIARYDALLDAASEEEAKGRDSGLAARLALARFLVGSDLAYEAIGVLNGLAAQHPEAMDLPEFRGLRGVARVLAHRYKEAEADFSAPTLSDDPSSALWRAYIAAQQNQWTETRQQFTAGAEAFTRFSPLWRARFARADARAALALGDLEGATKRINVALMSKVEPREELATRLVQARILEAQGQTAWALHIYDAVSHSSADYLQAPALLRATEIRYQRGEIKPAKAAAVYDGLRYRWRGDATELETIRALGNLYLSQGRYREALEILRTAGQRMAYMPQAADLQADLDHAFRGLFLDGLADGLEPIQALAMFYDFKDLTPPGADGDLMVRKLARRLVDVDLLPQAAELLDYQVNNRLDGVPRAQVATDLATIYLMDHKPEKALQAINASRTTILPSALNAERRLVEARALMGLNRLDFALEVLGKDASPDGQALRAEITWKQKDWPAAGAQFEKLLGDRWKQPGALSPEEEGDLLRAGVSYSLAGDETSLARLEQRYQGFFAQASNPEALKVALTGVSTDRLSVSDFSRVSANDAAFTGWVEKMKQKFRDKPAPVGAPTPKAAGAAPAAPAKQASASPPAATPKKG